MDTLQSVEKRSTGFGPQRSEHVGDELARCFAGRYRALKRRIREMLMRGDRDYSILSALSQEIGRIRQRIRTDHGLIAGRARDLRPLGAVSGWVAADNTADGWISWSGKRVDPSGGIVVGMLWPAGTLVISAAMAVIRRHAA